MKKFKNDERIKVLGVTFEGVKDMIYYAREKKPKEGIYVGYDSQGYPCFDSEDYLNEDRSYWNFVFAKSRDVLHYKLAKLKRMSPIRCDYDKLTGDLHPMAYWGGDAHDGVVLTEASDMGETEKKKGRTQVYNVIILDKSGSMSCIRRAAVEGFNETLAGIRKAQEKYSDTQEHYVSLVTFCNCEIRNVFDKVPVADACPLGMEDYEPCCGTPLYDAMGITLTAMRRHVRDKEDAVVVVTIITDGMENASKEYDRQAIRGLVETLRDKGWSFTYMGANQNSLEVGRAMSIRNTRDFAYTDMGTRETMRRDCSTRMNFFGRLSLWKHTEEDGVGAIMSAEERGRLYTSMMDDAFEEEEGR